MQTTQDVEFHRAPITINLYRAANPARHKSDGNEAWPALVEAGKFSIKEENHRVVPQFGICAHYRNIMCA